MRVYLLCNQAGKLYTTLINQCYPHIHNYSQVYTLDSQEK